MPKPQIRHAAQQRSPRNPRGKDRHDETFYSRLFNWQLTVALQKHFVGHYYMIIRLELLEPLEPHHSDNVLNGLNDLGIRRRFERV